MDAYILQAHITLASFANSPLPINLTCFNKLCIHGTHIEVSSMILIYIRLASFWKKVKSTLIPSFSNDIVAKCITSKVIEPKMVVTPNPSQYINYNVFLREYMIFGAIVLTWKKCRTHIDWLILNMTLIIPTNFLE